MGNYHSEVGTYIGTYHLSHINFVENMVIWVGDSKPGIQIRLTILISLGLG